MKNPFDRIINEGLNPCALFIKKYIFKVTLVSVAVGLFLSILTAATWETMGPNRIVAQIDQLYVFVLSFLLFFGVIPAFWQLAHYWIRNSVRNISEKMKEAQQEAQRKAQQELQEVKLKEQFSKTTEERTSGETIIDDAGYGDRFGRRYEILREIGRGGMGIVYEAINRKIQKQVAIKKLKEELSISPRERKRFMDEARRVAELHHPNIVEIYDMCDEGNDIYLIFEYINGETIDSLLNKHGKLNLKETLEIGLAVCLALEYAHGKKIIHRDIKPSNIMITKERSIKVMDFGIAREAKETFSRLTSMDISGTMSYMAPEQHLGKWDERSDLYSVGVMIYEMLSGDVPFRGADLCLQKREMAYKPIKELIPDIPETIDVVITKCLQAYREKRYQTAGELMNALTKGS